MGYRTVVIFNNDMLGRLTTDPSFANRLNGAIMSQVLPEYSRPRNQEFEVVEQNHADVVTLLEVDSLSAREVAHTKWNDPDKEVNLLKEMAAKLGYRVVKK